MQHQQNSIINSNLLNAIYDYLRTQPHANVDGLIQGIRQCQPVQAQAMPPNLTHVTGKNKDKNKKETDPHYENKQDN